MVFQQSLFEKDISIVQCGDLTLGGHQLPTMDSITPIFSRMEERKIKMEKMWRSR